MQRNVHRLSLISLWRVSELKQSLLAGADAATSNSARAAISAQFGNVFNATELLNCRLARRLFAIAKLFGMQMMDDSF